MLLLLLLPLSLLAPTLKREREQTDMPFVLLFYSRSYARNAFRIGIAVVSRRCVQGNMRPRGAVLYEISRNCHVLIDPGCTTIVDRNERLTTLAFVSSSVRSNPNFACNLEILDVSKFKNMG